MLVVDDDEANRESLSRRLRRRGMIVDLAEDGTPALRQIDAAPYNLILLDVMMPGISGIDMLQTVRQTRSSTERPIVMATANDGSTDIARALELGANDYITKPIDFTVALARINTQLDLGRAVKRQQQLQNELSLRNAELENAVDTISKRRRSIPTTASGCTVTASSKPCDPTACCTASNDYSTHQLRCNPTRSLQPPTNS